jgi:UPF0755 protein
MWKRRSKKYYYEGDISNRTLVATVAGIMAVIAAGFFIYNLGPVAAGRNAAPVVFQVTEGEGVRGVAGALYQAGLVKSAATFEGFSVLDYGQASHLQPGLYQLNAGMSSPEILTKLADTANRAVSVTIPEGANVYEIDGILAKALVIRRGDLIDFTQDGNLEGMLFPDTYEFFPGSNVQDVVGKLLQNFQAKAAPTLDRDAVEIQKNLIVASLLEKEVPGAADQAIVAGIIGKRLAAGMPLDIDATLCYVKQQANPTSTAGCYPITAKDEETDSPYNTYLHRGLPPTPIGSPGIQAITAAMNPKSSPYWYYLSDPATGKTIFAATLAEQVANQRRYLE